MMAYITKGHFFAPSNSLLMKLSYVSSFFIALRSLSLVVSSTRIVVIMHIINILDYIYLYIYIYT